MEAPTMVLRSAEADVTVEMHCTTERARIYYSVQDTAVALEPGTQGLGW